jgi:hypothetical protein
MKKVILVLIVTSIFTSCSENKSSESNTVASGTDSLSAAAAENMAKTGFAYPVKYLEWEIGKAEHIKTVLDFYKAWDNKEAGKVAGLFADTLRLRIPTEKQEIVLPNSQINNALAENRGMYDSTSNNIISAISLHDRERNEDWVMITTYNKWVEVDGKRDSLLYHDEWRIKNGKIDFLWSFYKLPTKAFLKTNDPKK